MDEQGADPAGCHGLCGLLDSAVGRDRVRYLLCNISHLYGKQAQVFITATDHLVPAQFGIGSGNDFLGKTFQIVLGKTGLTVNQVKKDFPGQQKTEGILHGFDVQIGRGAANNRQSPHISTFAPVILKGDFTFIVNDK